MVENGLQLETGPTVANIQRWMLIRHEEPQTGPLHILRQMHANLIGPTGINSSIGPRHVPSFVRFTQCRIRRPGWR